MARAAVGQLLAEAATRFFFDAEILGTPRESMRGTPPVAHLDQSAIDRFGRGLNLDRCFHSKSVRGRINYFRRGWNYRECQDGRQESPCDSHSFSILVWLWFNGAHVATYASSGGSCCRIGTGPAARADCGWREMRHGSIADLRDLSAFELFGG